MRRFAVLAIVMTSRGLTRLAGFAALLSMTWLVGTQHAWADDLDYLPAQYGLTGFATWNNGPASDPGWDPADPAAQADYPSWVDEPGLDWVRAHDGPSQAVSGWPWVSPRRYPNSDGVGKWDGALKDDPEDGGFYVVLNNGQPPGDPMRTLVNEEGTIEFWFKPMWDPATETNQHALVIVNLASDNKDGLFIAFEGDGTMGTTMITQSINEGGPLTDVGHDWTSMPLINDWNHVAFAWDSAGNYTYCNGSKVGETIYGGTAPEKVDWADTMYIMFGQEGQSTTDYQSDGLWDSLAIWHEVLYTGADYAVPIAEITQYKKGDLGKTGFVGQADLDIVLATWGESGAELTYPRADVNEDGFVGQADLDYVLADWGSGWGILPTPVPDPATLWLLGVAWLAAMRRWRR